jgi:hypothetical protein
MPAGGMIAARSPDETSARLIKGSYLVIYSTCRYKKEGSKATFFLSDRPPEILRHGVLKA